MRRGLAYNRKESSLYRTNILDDPAFARVAGAPLVKGNKVGLLKDAGENYPAWISAIESAKRYINFECYIVHDDDIGQKFADLLESKAREGSKGPSPL
jgi:cardiolipin synthase A/B